MKKIKYFIVLSFSIFCAHFYGMGGKRSAPFPSASTTTAAKRGSPEAVRNQQPQAFIVPPDNIRDQLFSLLKSAQRQVLVAMYWITDHTIVDKLIELKQRGINVEIIFDESSHDRMRIMNKLLHNNIVPIIFTSEMRGFGLERHRVRLMHNKFVVVDDTVFTGSANFTRKAFDQSLGRNRNYENIVILHSPRMAQQYQTTFRNIEEETFNLYVELVATVQFLPGWSKVIFRLYRNRRFYNILNSRWGQFNQAERERLFRFFSSQVNPPSKDQMDELESYGISSQGLSSQAAYILIGEIRDQIKAQRRRVRRSRK